MNIQLPESTFKELLSRLLDAFSSGSSKHSFRFLPGIQRGRLAWIPLHVQHALFWGSGGIGGIRIPWPGPLRPSKSNLRNSDNCIKVFRQTIGNRETVLYGIGLKGDTGEGHFSPSSILRNINTPHSCPMSYWWKGIRCTCFMDVSESRSVFRT